MRCKERKRRAGSWGEPEVLYLEVEFWKVSGRSQMIVKSSRRLDPRCSEKLIL